MINPMRQDLFLKLGLVGLIWGLDSLIKFLLGSSIHFSWNTGVAFGLFPNVTWEWLIVFLLIIVWRQWQKVRSRVLWYGWGFIFAGGWSNLVDRIVFGSVRDYILYPIIGVYGNLADIFIVIGGLLIAYCYYIAEKEN